MNPPPGAPSPPFLNRQANQLLAAQPGLGGMKPPGSIIGAANSQGIQQPQMQALLRSLMSGGNKLGI